MNNQFDQYKDTLWYEDDHYYYFLKPGTKFSTGDYDCNLGRIAKSDNSLIGWTCSCSECGELDNAYKINYPFKRKLRVG